MRQLFSIDAMRAAIYGESAASIWQSFNQHVVVPKAAFDGFMKSFYTPMGLEEIVPAHTELNCPDSMPGHPGENEPKDLIFQLNRHFLFFYILILLVSTFLRNQRLNQDSFSLAFTTG